MKVSNWFANARRRLKNVVQENHCSWSKRLRLYNQFVQGNAELLSISSDDSIWNSDEEDSVSGGNSKGRKKRPQAPATTSSETEDKDNNLENAESVQYKKTMLQRYLNDAIQVATTTSTGDDSPSVTSSPSKPSVTTAAPAAMPLARLYWPPPPAPPVAPHPFPWLPALPASVLHYMNTGTSNGVIAFYF